MKTPETTSNKNNTGWFFYGVFWGLILSMTILLAYQSMVKKEKSKLFKKHEEELRIIEYNELVKETLKIMRENDSLINLMK